MPKVFSNFSQSIERIRNPLIETRSMPILFSFKLFFMELPPLKGKQINGLHLYKKDRKSLKE